jgi:hypothetical protein
MRFTDVREGEKVFMCEIYPVKGLNERVLMRE